MIFIASVDQMCLDELLGYLFKSLQDLLPLTEVSKEQVEGFGHQRRIVMHG